MIVLERRMNIFWFRQDLRLSDNPAWIAAAGMGAVLPVYILDDENAGENAMGAASRVFLHHALRALNERLDGHLHVYRGRAEQILASLVTDHNAQGVIWNRCYEPWRIKRDQALKARLEAQNLSARSFNGSLLWEPWEVRKSDGEMYKVFTPFYRAALAVDAPPRPESAPSVTLAERGGDGLESLELLPHKNWHQALCAHWQISEKAAQAQLREFVANRLNDYAKGRDYPAQNAISKLSPHLHFGTISPRQAWHAANASSEGAAVFRRELGWREFSYHLLYHFPNLRRKNWQSKFDHFPWEQDDAALRAWQKGQTGIPIIDAGMRELWQTGFMHNRVRMVVASFLTKNLRLDWRLGEAWFWDCLLDADHASNAASWQWVAGSGADAAPYFRIFNPVLQSEKFDKEGKYIRQFVPELGALEGRYIHAPWKAPKEVLQKAQITLGEGYPLPIVDLASSRQAALEAYAQLPK